MSTGRHIAAARMLGADLAYMGTRFLATRECIAPADQKEMIRAARAEDIVYTPAISGVNGNFLRDSIRQAGLDPDILSAPEEYNFGTDEVKAWKEVWAAGQGVGSIDDIPTVAELCERLSIEYHKAIAEASGWN
jgi:nitronate monooxygenase